MKLPGGWCLSYLVGVPAPLSVARDHVYMFTDVKVLH